MISSNDGMFRLARPEKPFHFTGERLTSAISGGVEMEHLHRYCFARDLCVGRDVLDVASGEGYGTAMLAGVARSVLGVERDAEAVDHACRTYASGNLRFEAGDALDLSLGDASVDVVVSFETIEHLPDQRRFLKEVRRVLRPGGLFLVSTPDRQVHSGIGMPVNPHHVLELSRPELEALLGETFTNVAVLAQRTLVGSALLTTGAGLRTYERRDAVTIEATSGVARAVYLIAVASDGPLPAIPASIYSDEKSVDALFGSIAYQAGETAKAQAEADRLFHTEAAARSEAERLRAALARTECAARDAQATRQAATEERSRIEAERDRVVMEWDRAVAEQDRVFEERNRIVAERDQIVAERDRALAERDHLLSEVAALRAATGVRLGLYASYQASRLPTPIRKALQRTLGVAMRKRRALIGAPAVEQVIAVTTPEPVAPPKLDSRAAPMADPRPAIAPIVAQSAATLIANRYASLEPFPCFQEAYPRPRLSVVTDSIGPSSLFGGVGTSILLGALLANRLKATLRIVTRTEPSDASQVGHVLANNGVTIDGAVEMAYAPLDGSRDLPVAEGEAYLTTSWWNTRATLGSVPRNRIIALVQEDERMFYPHGDDRLRCAETLSEPGFPTVVNTELLFRHLAGGREALPNLEREGLWFEPAFPQIAKPTPRGGRRRLFFYARPHNLRNLFWRGIEALDLALAEGLFAPDQWDMYWVGHDLPDVRLARGVMPIRTPNMTWGDYQSFIASMDAGFVLMDTPHPSYPPLDLAAAGAAVLTNIHPGKETLDQYSRNILMASSTRTGLLDGLRRLQGLAEDDAGRARNRAQDGIGRDWPAALEPVVARLARHLTGQADVP